MTHRPPSPPTPLVPTAATLSAGCHLEDRVVVTTAQLASYMADAFDCHVDEGALEPLLVELDRHGLLECVTVTQNGAYLWDLTDAPERIGDAIAAAVVGALESWLED
ncbi:hypothetical protein [Natronobiforma cellulositropha]|uniref:hypothetical protein n=1 Tax=Natronobiforma cellulositropha TaxID=1679076 RepID=UPI0021D5A75F|nr:hypothetical protein [Natronobiforma cellulositropha]